MTTTDTGVPASEASIESAPETPVETHAADTQPTEPTVRSMPLGKAINAGLRRAMEDSDRVLMMGEDIGDLGGVFRVTEGLKATFGDRRVLDTPLAESGIIGTAIGLAMVFVLLTYGGWSEAAYLSGELKDPARNMVRVLTIGTAILIGVYVLANLALLAILGLDGLRGSEAVAAVRAYATRSSTDARDTGAGGRNTYRPASVAGRYEERRMLLARAIRVSGSCHHTRRNLRRWGCRS